VKGVASLMVTLQSWSAPLPLAQVRTLFMAVKSFPATAVLLTVVQRTLAAPLAPPLRLTAIALTPKFCSAPTVPHDIDMVPVAVPAAKAADPVKLIPKQTSSDTKQNNSLSALGALALNFIDSIS
jgi:outer membrane receptor protein involved in Fe transport